MKCSSCHRVYACISVFGLSPLSLSLFLSHSVCLCELGPFLSRIDTHTHNQASRHFHSTKCFFLVLPSRAKQTKYIQQTHSHSHIRVGSECVCVLIRSLVRYYMRCKFKMGKYNNIINVYLPHSSSTGRSKTRK